MGSKSSTAPGCLTPQVRWEVTHGHWPGKIVVGLTPAKCQTRASERERERQLILSHQWFLFHPFFFLKIWHQGNSAIACRRITRNRASNRPGQKTILLNADREALETYNYSTPQGLPPQKIARAARHGWCACTAVPFPASWPWRRPDLTRGGGVVVAMRRRPWGGGPPSRSENQQGPVVLRGPTRRAAVGRPGDLGPHRNRHAPPAAAAPKSPYRLGRRATSLHPVHRSTNVCFPSCSDQYILI
jgi:hypothetical protein